MLQKLKVAGGGGSRI